MAGPLRDPEYISFEIHRRVIFPALDEIDVFDEAPTKATDTGYGHG